MCSSLKSHRRTTSAADRAPGTKSTARRGFWFLSFALLAVPVAAQEASLGAALPACNAAPGVAGTLLGGAGSYQPLAPEERLFYPLPDGAEASVEIRYFVDGALYLAERVDLAGAELPHVTVAPRALEDKKTSFDPRQLLEGERMFELLALRPDLVRQLRKTAADGSVVDVEAYLQGELTATLTFEELLRQSAELGASDAVPLVVQSTVEGPGDLGRPIQSITAKTYLEDCQQCTETMPCDTECGWDDGKGGPVTCGEQGLPCTPAGCQCEYSPSYSWTGWYQYAFYPNNPTYYNCYRSFFGGSRWHRLWIRAFRRDRIERKTICPSCPSCSGCYVQERVVEYQLTYSQCWLEESSSVCSFGARPCCSSLCQHGPFTPCNAC